MALDGVQKTTTSGAYTKQEIDAVKTELQKKGIAITNENLQKALAQTYGTRDDSHDITYTDGVKNKTAQTVTRKLNAKELNAKKNVLEFLKKVDSLQAYNKLVETINEKYNILLQDKEVAAALRNVKNNLPEIAYNKKVAAAPFDLAERRNTLAEKTEASHVVELQIEAENTRRKVLDYVKDINIAGAKEEINVEPKLQAELVENYQAFIDNEIIKVQILAIVPGIDIELTEEQKDALKTGFGEFANKTVQELGQGKEFNVDLKELDNLVNLEEPVTEENVAKQLERVNKLLANVNTGLEKAAQLRETKEKVLQQDVQVRLKPLLEDRQYYKNTIGTDGKTPLYEDKKYDAQVTQLEENIEAQQKNAMEVMTSIVEIESFEKAVTPLKEYLEKVQTKLNEANSKLNDIKTFDKEAQEKADKLHKQEVKENDKAQKAEKKTATEQGNSSNDVHTTSGKDENQKINDAYDETVNKKVRKKETKLKTKQKKHDNALEVAKVTQRKVEEYAAKEKELKKLRGEKTP